MRTKAPAFIKHTPVGKSTQAQPGTAGAHARYMARKAAAVLCISEGLMLDKRGNLVPFPRHWRAVQRFLDSREASIRKNGRVCDKLIISVPRECSPDMAEKIARAYGRRLGKGRAPFFATFHQEEHNPHLHVIFVDADPETGKRVFGTSERNSTDILKDIWANTVNEQFEQLGLETRISFDATQELEAVNDNTPPVEVSEHLPTDTPPAEIVAEPQADDVLDEPPLVEDDLATIPHVDADITPFIAVSGASLADNARLGASAAFELRRIRKLQAERQEVRDRYHAAHSAWQNSIAQAQQAEKASHAADLARAQARQVFTEEHHNFLGYKKGFSFSVFGYSYTSPARRAADAAEQQYQWAKAEAEQAAEAVLHAKAYAERTAQEKTTLEAEYDAVQGNEVELQDAGAVMEESLNQYAGSLSRETILNMGEDKTLTKEQVNVLLEELGYDKGDIEQEV